LGQSIESSEITNGTILAEDLSVVSAPSSNQVLSYTGTGMEWRTPTTGTVTGTGSANYMAYWNGATSLTGSSSLTYSSNMLSLSANSASGMELLRLINSSGSSGAYTFLRIGRDPSTYWGILSYDNVALEYSMQSSGNSSGGIALKTQTAAPIRFITNISTERMRVASDGNIGIGTTTPGALLDVYSSTTGVIRASGNTASYNGEYARIEFFNDQPGSDATASLRALAGGSDVGYGYTQLAFYTGSPLSGGTEKARITSSGNVGIGTTTPGQRLDVVGTIRANDPSYIGSRHLNLYSSSAQLIEATNDLYIGTTGATAIHLQPGRLGGSNGWVHIRDNGGTNWATFDGSNRRLTLAGDIYANRWAPQYTTWSGVGAGGAAIVNSNEASYQALMIVGNSSAGGSRVVKVWDILDVQGTLRRSGNQVWDAGNHGHGSGLNADMVDGIHGSSISTGSGTTNYVTKWTGTSSQGNSQIFDNGTNIGIGTTTPGSNKLYVQGYTSGFGAVRGTDQLGSTIYAEGQLGVLSPSGLPLAVTNVGVLGLKTNNGSNGAAV
jgi:hypothetical protein